MLECSHGDLLARAALKYHDGKWAPCITALVALKELKRLSHYQASHPVYKGTKYQSIKGLVCVSYFLWRMARPIVKHRETHSSWGHEETLVSSCTPPFSAVTSPGSPGSLIISDRKRPVNT